MSACDTGRVLVLVLADTHIREGGARTLPDEVWEAADRADVILHAGDVLTGGLLDELAERAPLHAVLGNNDSTLGRRLPGTVEIALGGVRVAMIHDSGSTKGRAARMRRRFPDATVVVYGHSHQPDDSAELEGLLLFNPGSCTERRRAPHRTYGLLDLCDGEIRSHQIIPIEG